MKRQVVMFKSREDQGRALPRIRSTAWDGKAEVWLQEMIFQHPDLLPVKEFDEQIGTVIPLGREVGVQAGSIDDLFVSTDGTLIIAETKLWKNPEMHREVVAQIIDYAKELAALTYDELEQAVGASRNGTSSETRTLRDIVSSYLPAGKGAFEEFQDRLLDKMQRGRFLLLIVGDEIRPNLLKLCNAISSAPGLEFELGLVELWAYQTENGKDWPAIVVSDVVGRVVADTRAVVKVIYEEKRPDVQVVVPKGQVVGAGRITLEELAASLPTGFQSPFHHWVQVWRKKGYELRLGKATLSVYRKSAKGENVHVCELYASDVTVRLRKKYLGGDKEYAAYRDRLWPIPVVRAVLEKGGNYAHTAKLTPEEFAEVLAANTELAETL